MLLNASLCETSYNVVMHEIKIKRILKNIKKKEQRRLLELTKIYI